MQLLHHRFKVFPITQPLFPIENRVCKKRIENNKIPELNVPDILCINFTETTNGFNKGKAAFCWQF